MDRAAIRAFASRDRTEVAAAKAAWWARADTEARFRAAHALWEHARRVRPDWPTADDRAADLAHHVRLKSLLDRAGRGIAGR